MREAAYPPSLRHRTEPLVEGALLAALLVLFGAVAFYTGFGWLQPIPVVLAYQRHGGRLAGLVVLVGSALLALWIGPFAALGSLGFAGALGLVAGWGSQQRLGPGTTIVLMALTLLAVTALGVVATIAVWHENIWTQMWIHFTQAVRAHATLLARLGLTPDGVLRAASGALPVMVVSVAVVEAGGVYVLASAVLRRLGMPLPPPPPLAKWRAPGWLLWLYAGTWLAELVAQRIGRIGAAGVTWNVLMGLGLLYSGVAVAAAFGWSRGRGLSRQRSAAVALLGGALLGVTVPSGLVLIGLVASHWPRGRNRHSV